MDIEVERPTRLSASYPHEKRLAMRKKPTSKKSGSDFVRLSSMSDDHIDRSEIPEVSPEQFARAMVRRGLKTVPPKAQLRSALTSRYSIGFASRGVATKRELIPCYGHIWKPTRRTGPNTRHKLVRLFCSIFVASCRQDGCSIAQGEAETARAAAQPWDSFATTENPAGVMDTTGLEMKDYVFRHKTPSFSPAGFGVRGQIGPGFR
jgi:hypothetical protein